MKCVPSPFLKSVSCPQVELMIFKLWKLQVAVFFFLLSEEKQVHKFNKEFKNQSFYHLKNLKIMYSINEGQRNILQE